MKNSRGVYKQLKERLVTPRKGMNTTSKMDCCTSSTNYAYLRGEEFN
jgi:hypothetical protein